MEEARCAAVSGAKVRVVAAESYGVAEKPVMAVAGPGTAEAGEQAEAVYGVIAKSLGEVSGGTVVAETIFGELADRDEVLGARRKALGEAGLNAEGPVNYIEGSPCEWRGLAGTNLTVVSGTGKVEPIGDGEGVRGYAVTAGGGKTVYLSGVKGTNGKAGGTAAEQAEGMFGRATELLGGSGLGYGQVICTRIYLKRLLEWYGEFNTVRNGCYRKLGLITEEGSRVPASTGIEGRTGDRCECAMDVTAYLGEGRAGCPYERLFNPLQNEATEYGASFARGASLEKGDLKYVIVSGTAAIDERGRSVHIGDPAGQAGRTLENFESILRSGGAGPRDLVRAVIYCKRPEYAGLFREEMRKHDWPDFPFVTVRADVCREELLVEIEGMALVKR